MELQYEIFGHSMTHVVTNNCRHCRFTECVDICPVLCFHANEARVYIDPERCTDCGACVPVCPVDAILREIDVEADEAHWIEINAKAVKRYDPIRKKQNPLPDAQLQRAKYGFT